MEISDKILSHIRHLGVSLDIHTGVGEEIIAEIDGPQIVTNAEDFSYDVELALGILNPGDYL